MSAKRKLRIVHVANFGFKTVKLFLHSTAAKLSNGYSNYPVGTDLGYVVNDYSLYPMNATLGCTDYEGPPRPVVKTSCSNRRAAAGSTATATEHRAQPGAAR